MSEDEARRTLRRMEDEQEKLLSGGAESDASDDPIERLGKRIARILGYVLAAFLVWYLWSTLSG